MSLLDQASLVLVPSAYRTGKVLVQKPLPTKFSDETGNYDGNDPQGSANLTFTRNSNASRVNADGKVEKVRTNLVLQSNTFNTTWTAVNSSLMSGQSGYDGTSNAWLLTKSNTGGRVQQSLSTLSSTSNTLSVYVKANASTWCAIEYGTSYRFLNLSTGAVSSGVGNYKVQSVGSGWYRLSINDPSPSATFRIYPAEADDVSAASGSIFIQNAQAEVSDFGPTAYIPTTTSARSTFAGITVDGTSVPNVPRLDYSGGATCGKLLLEPQATALLQYSEQLDNAAWTKNNATITANAITSPDGYANADKVTASAGNAAHSVYQVYNGPTGTYTHSAFFKAGEYSYAFLRAGGVTGSPYVIYNLATQAAVSSAACTHKIEAYGSGWFRISLVPTNTSGLHATNVMFLPSSGYTLDTANVPSWNADGTSGGYVWGVNLTQTSYVQSYIPTLGASVTRLADAAYKTGISSLIGQTEGTIFLELEFTHPNKGSNEYLVQLRKDSPNRMLIYRSSSTQTIGAVILNQGSNVFNSVSLVGNNTKHKIALAYKSGDMALYIDGSQVSTSTNTFAAYSLLSDLDLGINNLSGTPVEIGDYDYNQALLFKTRLTNAQLAELTAL